MSRERHANTFPVYSSAVAAHLAVLGHRLTLVPSRDPRQKFVWLAPSEASEEARRMILTLRLLNEERAGCTRAPHPDTENPPDARYG